MIELGYWKIRGLVGGARVMLEHAGAGNDSSEPKNCAELCLRNYQRVNS